MRAGRASLRPNVCMTALLTQAAVPAAPAARLVSPPTLAPSLPPATRPWPRPHRPHLQATPAPPPTFGCSCCASCSASQSTPTRPFTSRVRNVCARHLRGFQSGIIWSLSSVYFTNNTTLRAVSPPACPGTRCELRRPSWHTAIAPLYPSFTTATTTPCAPYVLSYRHTPLPCCLTDLPPPSRTAF